MPPETTSPSRGADEVSLTPGAKRLWVEWVNSHNREQDQDGFPEYLYGPWAKLESYCARFALILCETHYVCGEINTEEVDEMIMRKAITLVEYFKDHTRRTYARLRCTPEDRKVLDALNWIRRHGGQATAREMLRGNVAGVKKAVEAEHLLRELVERGYGTLTESPSRGKKSLHFMLAKDRTTPND